MTTDEFTPALNELMEFDHVIVVHEDGTITDAPNDRRYWAPDLNDDELSQVIIDGQLVGAWEFFTTGYSGQDHYSGPIMHNSEFIGGGLERDIRKTPGVYVALVSRYFVEHEMEDYVEGWAIARLKDEFAKEITQ